MPKRSAEKTPAQIRQLSRPGLHAVGGVAGLCIQVKESGAKSWLLRTTVGGRRRSIGLGAFPDVPLKDAREAARDMKYKIRDGVDPVEDRKAAQRALADANASRITFDEAARKYLAAKRQEFRNPKHARQWETTLAHYASPVIGNMPVHEVELSHVVRILEPIWYTKTETAARLRGRIEHVLAWATTSGYRSGDNPARWKGHLDTILPKPSKVQNIQHHRALPMDQVGEFMTKLRQREGMAARALEFLILTATRSGEVRGATWDEVDLSEKVWRIPGERMKAGREHRVPLAPEAVRLLERLPRYHGSPYVFPATRGGPLSDMAISQVMKRMEYDATPHGFRSTFRDWAAERTAYANEVIEQALAHTITNAVERAYRRGDLFNKRSCLMHEWATFCGQPMAGDNVRHLTEVTS